MSMFRRGLGNWRQSSQVFVQLNPTKKNPSRLSRFKQRLIVRMFKDRTPICGAACSANCHRLERTHRVSRRVFRAVGGSGESRGSLESGRFRGVKFEAIRCGWGGGNLPGMSEPSLSFITIYQLRVVPCGVSPLVWRHLLVASDTIAELHEILQGAFDWSGEHLHLNGQLRGLAQDREVRR
jgi:hypothetical protein